MVLCESVGDDMKRYNLVLLVSFIITTCALVLLTVVDYNFAQQEQSVVAADTDLLGALTNEDGKIYTGNIELESWASGPYPNSITYKEAVEYAKKLLSAGNINCEGFQLNTTYVVYTQTKDIYDIYFDVTTWANSSEGKDMKNRYPLEYAYYVRMNMYNKNVDFVMTTIKKGDAENIEKYKPEIEPSRIEQFCRTYMIDIGLGNPIIVQMTEEITPSKDGIILSCRILAADMTHYIMSVEYPQMRLVHLVKKDEAFQ